MEHRGACGAEEETGDGAGILTALPYEFLDRIAQDELQAQLPRPGKFGAGWFFCRANKTSAKPARGL
ncbi:MAG: hypothetical protein Ct9H300mP16_09220 [Pseudomonadota bacterium]|nr:MAG: hypothetical protein Ct9H300mP16_09220 [Pseudomonadota bacterium]